MNRFSFLLTIVLLLTFSACGYNVFGINNDDDNNNVNNVNNSNNANNTNNIIPPNYLSRGKLYVDLVRSIMGLDLGSEPCEATFADVETDSTLCRAMEKMTSIGHIPPGMPDENFRPNDTVVNAEVWSIVTSYIGFIQYEEVCADDLNEDTWYKSMAGSLCLKGLLPVDEDNLAHPSDGVTVEEWEDFSENLLDYMMAPPTRKHSLEGVLVVLGHSYGFDAGDCISTYEDIDDDTFLCHLTNLGIDEELLDANQANFRPEDSFSWSEFNKMMLVLANVPEGQYTGCSGTSIDHWGAGYNDAICEAGVLHPDFSENETPVTVQTMYQAIWLAHSAFLPPIGG